MMESPGVNPDPYDLYQNQAEINEVMVTINQQTGRLKYQEGRGHITSAFKWGQRKLFLSEFQFLTEMMDSYQDDGIVIYAGAAPSHHTYHLHEYFPNLKFLLVDPREVQLIIEPGEGKQNRTQYDRPDDIIYFRANPNTSNQNVKWIGNDQQVRFVPKSSLPSDDLSIKNGVSDQDLLSVMRSRPEHFYIIEDYFTYQLAQVIGTSLQNNPELGPIYFVSDIRSSGDEDPRESDVIWNSYQQIVWVDLIQPTGYSLKFRVPFFANVDLEQLMQEYLEISIPEVNSYINEYLGVDVVEYIRNQQYAYVDTSTYFQVWAPYISSESRLVSKIPVSDLNWIVYDVPDYEDLFSYRNLIYRNQRNFIHFYSVADREYTHTPDYALEAIIWQTYYDKFYEIGTMSDADLINIVTTSSDAMTDYLSMYKINFDTLIKRSERMKGTTIIDKVVDPIDRITLNMLEYDYMDPSQKVHIVTDDTTDPLMVGCRIRPTFGARIESGLTVVPPLPILSVNQSNINYKFIEGSGEISDSLIDPKQFRSVKRITDRLSTINSFYRNIPLANQFLVKSFPLNTTNILADLDAVFNFTEWTEFLSKNDTQEPTPSIRSLAYRLTRVRPSLSPPLPPTTPSKVVPKIAPRVVPKIIPRVVPKIAPRVVPKIVPRVIPRVVPRVVPVSPSKTLPTRTILPSELSSVQRLKFIELGSRNRSTIEYLRFRYPLQNLDGYIMGDYSVNLNPDRGSVKMITEIPHNLKVDLIISRSCENIWKNLPMAIELNELGDTILVPTITLDQEVQSIRYLIKDLKISLNHLRPKSGSSERGGRLVMKMLQVTQEISVQFITLVSMIFDQVRLLAPMNAPLTDSRVYLVAESLNLTPIFQTIFEVLGRWEQSFVQGMVTPMPQLSNLESYSDQLRARIKKINITLLRNRTWFLRNMIQVLESQEKGLSYQLPIDHSQTELEAIDLNRCATIMSIPIPGSIPVPGS